MLAFKRHLTNKPDKIWFYRFDRIFEITELGIQEQYNPILAEFEDVIAPYARDVFYLRLIFSLELRAASGRPEPEYLSATLAMFDRHPIEPQIQEILVAAYREADILRKNTVPPILVEVYENLKWSSNDHTYAAELVAQYGYSERRILFPKMFGGEK